VIKGSDEGKAAAENAALEKLITYQSNLHAQRVAAKSKQVASPLRLLIFLFFWCDPSL